MQLGLNAFITTLAMLILLRGITLGLTNGQTLFDLPEPFLYLGTAKWFGVPVLDLDRRRPLSSCSACSCATTGSAAPLYAIGGNAEAARVAGIPRRAHHLAASTSSAACSRRSPA